nr:hypothetical protein Iba_chr12bCG2900 [Ipomoea batatas]
MFTWNLVSLLLNITSQRERFKRSMLPCPLMKFLKRLKLCSHRQMQRLLKLEECKTRWQILIVAESWFVLCICYRDDYIQMVTIFFF